MVRAKYVKRLLGTVVVLLVIWWLFYASTPPACRVPISQMSDYCKTLIFN